MALAAPALAPVPAVADAAPSPIRHIWVIDLENSSWRSAFGNSPASDPYKREVMTSLGTVVENYYGIGHNSLDNYIAQVSGQAPTPDTQGDCLAASDLTPGTADAPMGQAIGQGCVYPARVKTIADQLQAQGMTWKGYEEDMGNDLVLDGSATCSTANGNGNPPNTPTDHYLAKHNPFVWFHSVLDDGANCRAHVVPLTELATDLQRYASTPNFSFVSPNLNDDDHDLNSGSASSFHYSDGWLHYYLPLIMASPAYRQDGMIVITIDEASSLLGFVGQPDDQMSCCGEIPGPNSPMPGIGGPGGGKVGAEIISPYVKPGQLTNVNSYNHYSALRSYEDLLGITTGGADHKGHLGYAAGNGIADSTPAYTFRAFGCDDIFTMLCPPMGTQVGAPGPDTASTDVGPRAADGSAHWLNPGPQGNDLYSISCATDTRCVAVGATGSVVSTVDGTSWSPRLSGTSTDLQGVSCAPASDACVAVGAGGKVITSGDGGETWSAGHSGTDKDLNGVSCASATACHAVGADGTMIASSDAGSTWSPEDSHTTTDLAQIACPGGGTCYATGATESVTSGYQGTALFPTTTNKPDVLTTSDGGATWAGGAAATQGRTRGIACVDAHKCTAGDERGGFSYVDLDEAPAWAPATSASVNSQQARVRGITCLPDSDCVAVGESGFTYRSTDGGRHWSVASSRDDFLDLYGVSCPSSATCYAVGRNGAIVTSADAGTTWTASGVNGAASNLMRSVQGYSAPPAQTVGAVDLAGTSCADASSCVSVGKQGTVLVSGDGGGSWRSRHGVQRQDPQVASPGGGTPPTPAPIPSTPDAAAFNAVSCATPASCVAVGERGAIAMTDDLGSDGGTWTSQTSNTTDTLDAVSCASAGRTCFAVGDYGTILKGTDGGSTWEKQDSGTSSYLNGVGCSDANDCVAVGSQGTILATTDGNAWQARTSPTASYLSAVSCAGGSSCLAVGSAGTVVGSDDGGHTWSLRTAPSADDLYAVSCTTASACIAAGSAGTVASTTDGGSSWSLQGTGANAALRSVSCPAADMCFAAGDNGAVLAIVPRPPSGVGDDGGGHDTGGGNTGGGAVGAGSPETAGSGETAGRGGNPDVVAPTVTASAPSAAAPRGRPQTRVVAAAISSRRHMARFRFRATGGAGPYRFECKLVPRRRHRSPSRFRACGSPQLYRHLAPGSYALEVRAVDSTGAADRSAALRRFRIAR